MTLFSLFLQPRSAKLNAIIEKTANFICSQGSQMEIRIKMKQHGNPQFDFLHFENRLNAYYKHMVMMIKSGRWRPVVKPTIQPAPVERQESK